MCTRKKRVCHPSPPLSPSELNTHSAFCFQSARTPLNMAPPKEKEFVPFHQEAPGDKFSRKVRENPVLVSAESLNK